MMTLDEAIIHAEQVAELNEAECFECAEEHRQLAEWLKELKRVRELPWLKELKALREQKRPHGEWHTTPNPNHSPFDSTSEVIYMCSQCAYSSGDRITATWNFCPSCGADMREGEAK